MTPTKGRPTLTGKKMKQTAVWLPDEMIAWLKAQPGTMSEKIRQLVEDEMSERKYYYCVACGSVWYYGEDGEPKLYSNDPKSIPIEIFESMEERNCGCNE